MSKHHKLLKEVTMIKYLFLMLLHFHSTTTNAISNTVNVKMRSYKKLKDCTDIEKQSEKITFKSFYFF